MASNRPFFVLLPGGSQNPTHYGYLAHLLQLAGYPTYSALLPSVGASGKVTTEDDMTYIRDRMILPILDYECHDVILVMHSYSGVPGSAAALGLGKKERMAQGKKTGVIGQIYFAAILQKGGDGVDIFTASGGSFPPYIRPDVSSNLVVSSLYKHRTSLLILAFSMTQIWFDATTVFPLCTLRYPQHWQMRLLHPPWRRA
jgi:hypothetical protein